MATCEFRPVLIRALKFFSANMAFSCFTSATIKLTFSKWSMEASFIPTEPKP